MARLLVALGADPDALDDRHDTPWLVTGVTGSVAMLEALLPADPDLTIRNRFGGVSVIPASERGHVDYVRRVVQTGIDVNHVNDLGWTALLEAVILGDGSAPYQQIVRILLDAGADPAIADGDGVTALAARRPTAARPRSRASSAREHEPMATITVDGLTVRVTFPTREKLLGLVRDYEVPVSSVVGAREVGRWRDDLRGLRVGLGLPGVWLLGTWLGARPPAAGGAAPQPPGGLRRAARREVRRAAHRDAGPGRSPGPPPRAQLTDPVSPRSTVDSSFSSTASRSAAGTSLSGPSSSSTDSPCTAAQHTTSAPIRSSGARAPASTSSSSTWPSST